MMRALTTIAELLTLALIVVGSYAAALIEAADMTDAHLAEKEVADV